MVLRMAGALRFSRLTPMTWTELVLSAAPDRGDRLAVTEVRTGEVLSYATLARRVTQAAAGLRRRGLRPGERVAVDLPPGIALLLAVHSVSWAGGVVSLSHPNGQARMIVTHGPVSPQESRPVFTVEPTPGASPFHELYTGEALEFGPIAGPALALGERVLSQADLTDDLRRLAKSGLFARDDVILAAVSDRLRLLRLLDVALMAGAHVVLAYGPTLIGCRVLMAEHRAGVLVAPPELARKVAGQPGVRVFDEAMFGQRP